MIGQTALGDGKFEAGGASPKEMGWGFSCGQGVKTMCFHCRGCRFKSWPGDGGRSGVGGRTQIQTLAGNRRSHMPCGTAKNKKREMGVG